MSFKIKKEIILYIAFFMLLLPFLQGSVGILPGAWRYCFVLIVATVLIIFYHHEHITIPRKDFLVWSCLLIPCLQRNYDIQIGKQYHLIAFLGIFIIYIFLHEDDVWIVKFWDIVRIYGIVHFALGIFFLWNKGLLYSVVIPRFTMTPNGYHLLTQAIGNGYMTGICNHYSKMGMYMALGTIAFAVPLFQKSENGKKKKIILFGAFVLGLAMTGKRGPLLFTLIALSVVWYQFANKKITKKNLIRIIGSLIVIVTVLIIAYLKVPQVKSVIERFSEGGTLEEQTNGRIDYFWIQAIAIFKRHPFIGRGWGTFKRTSFHGNNAHNIYLQLLAETGIIGFVMVGIFFAGSLIIIKKEIDLAYKTKIGDSVIIGLKLAYAYQIFFLLYGLTGNPLYDGECYVPYLMSCAMGWCAYFLNRNMADKSMIEKQNRMRRIRIKRERYE